MSELGKYDALAHIPITLEDIKFARSEAEKIINTSKGALQYDVVSRQRMLDALISLDPEDHTSTVTWAMADNEQIQLNHVEMGLLIKEANCVIGPHSIMMFEKANYFKDLLNTGSTLTMRDIAPEAWKV